MKDVYHAIPEDRVMVRASDVEQAVGLAEDLGRRYWGEADDPLWLVRLRTQLAAQEV